MKKWINEMKLIFSILFWILFFTIVRFLEVDPGVYDWSDEHGWVDDNLLPNEDEYLNNDADDKLNGLDRL